MPAVESPEILTGIVEGISPSASKEQVHHTLRLALCCRLIQGILDYSHLALSIAAHLVLRLNVGRFMLRARNGKNLIIIS